jgi:hypothetical protein
MHEQGEFESNGKAIDAFGKHIYVLFHQADTNYCSSLAVFYFQTARIADLNKQLQRSKAQAASYIEKNRHQDHAILSAQRELGRLLTSIRKLESENTRLQQDVRIMHDLKENTQWEEKNHDVCDSVADEKKAANSHEVENRTLRQQLKSLEEAKSRSSKTIGLIEAIQVYKCFVVYM